ncbi:hypothetical protein [Gillisia sp. JM1]|uniref:hypothetical protein n=1 Tax=Gillisia sp. JM1 TaxID=1283286 RepID=UPI000406063E|nr:hypothetical protein [Gillisia sp. JM1]
MSTEKILWICKESFTGLAHFSLPHFSKYENEALFVHPTESLLCNDTYVKFCKFNNSLKIHTLNEIANQYSQTVKDKSYKVDENKIKNFENKYCKDLPWGILLMSSQIFTSQYHYRFYFKDISDSEKNLWVILLFEYFENLINSSKPDFIFDFDNSEIGRTILWLIAKYNGIPYINIEHSRFKGYLLPTFNLGRKVDSYFIEEFQETKADSGNVQAVFDYRDQDEIVVKDYENNKTLKKKNNSAIKDIKKLFHYQKKAFFSFLLRVKLLGYNYKFPFIAAYPQTGIFFFKTIIRERFLLSKLNVFFENPVDGEKYIYFPLHLIPESSTLIKAPLYPNEEDVIAAVAKSMPANWKLYLKEHGAMIGERPFSFYKKISRLSNVKFIKLDAYNDPKTWITKSEGVITLTGTTAFESVMLGKPAIVLGNVSFEMIEGVKKCDNYSHLSKLIKEHFENFRDLNNELSCSKYLKLVKKYGVPVEFTYLHNVCLRLLIDEQKITPKGESQIKSLIKIFTKGIDLVKSRKVEI